MRVPASTKPAVWSALGGAIAMTIVGFWGMGWTTSRNAEHMAQERADAAVVAALVPFCVAKAQQDADGTKLVKFHAEESAYSRGELVSDAGWATVLGTTSPNRDLARACSDKLQPQKAS